MASSKLGNLDPINKDTDTQLQGPSQITMGHSSSLPLPPDSTTAPRDKVISALASQRDEFILHLDAVASPTTRPLSRHSDIRIRHPGQSEDAALESTVVDFFTALLPRKSVKHKAVEGATHLLRCRLDLVFRSSHVGPDGVRTSSGSAIILVPLESNPSLVRVDFCIGALSDLGCCYVAEMTPLDAARFTEPEMNFIIASALLAPSTRALSDVTNTFRKKNNNSNQKDVAPSVTAAATSSALFRRRVADRRDAEIMSKMKTLLTFQYVLKKNKKSASSSSDAEEFVRKIAETSLSLKKLFEELEDYQAP